VLDQGVPRDAVGRLRDLGYDCVHVGEAGMSMAADEAILSFALGRNGVVVTLDSDFHAILAFPVRADHRQTQQYCPKQRMPAESR